MVSRREFVGLAAAAVGNVLLTGCEQQSEPQETPAPVEEEQSESMSKDRLSGQDGKDKSDEQASQDDGDATDEEPSAVAAANGELKGPVLVAYFSRAGENFARGGNEWLYQGHTKTMAQDIIWTIGADEYEIIPSVAYPTTYDECLTQAKEEKEQDARPDIYYDLPDVSAYNTILIGCPIWWEQEPMIIRTFLEGVNLDGKSVVPFTTHGESGLGSVPGNIQTFAPGAMVHEGYTVEGTEVDESYAEIVEWAQGLGIEPAEEEDSAYSWM